MNWKCALGKHQWKKLGGPWTRLHSIEHKLICEKCGKVKRVEEKL